MISFYAIEKMRENKPCKSIRSSFFKISRKVERKKSSLKYSKLRRFFHKKRKE